MDEANIFDFYCMNSWMVIRSKRKFTDESEEYIWWISALTELENSIGPENIEAMKGKAGLKSSDKIVREGIKMVVELLREC